MTKKLRNRQLSLKTRKSIRKKHRNQKKKLRFRKKKKRNLLRLRNLSLRVMKNRRDLRTSFIKRNKTYLNSQ
jgi:hypothetical protein